MNVQDFFAIIIPDKITNITINISIIDNITTVTDIVIIVEVLSPILKALWVAVACGRLLEVIDSIGIMECVNIIDGTIYLVFLWGDEVVISSQHSPSVTQILHGKYDSVGEELEVLDILQKHPQSFAQSQYWSPLPPVLKK